MTPRGRKFWSAAAMVLAATVASGCASKGDDSRSAAERVAAPTEAQIGVNSFLWQASLDTLSFMPLTSADSKGGVIITDWFSDPNTPNERFKATVYILDTRLRADAVKVNIFKQVKTGTAWADASPDPDTGLQIENAILRQARELKLATLGN